MSVCFYLYKHNPNVFKDESKRFGWSDGYYHDCIDITYFNSVYRGEKGWRKYRNKLEAFNPCITNIDGVNQKYVPVDQVKYTQGWFLNNRFYKKKCTTIICTTKQEMENFFKRYSSHKIRSRYYKVNFYSSKLREIFSANWEDGMIFMCSW